MLGRVRSDRHTLYGFANYDVAAGLNIIAIQTTYFVKSYIRNVTAYGNTKRMLGGNMLLRINCNMAIQVTQLNSTGGDYHGFELKMNIPQMQLLQIRLLHVR